MQSRGYSESAVSAERSEAAVADAREAEAARTKCLMRGKAPSRQELGECSTEEVFDALVKLRSKQSTRFFRDMDLHGRIMQLVGELVRNRRQRPTPFIYECVMDAMADPQGSASGVRKLLDDMASLKLAPTVDLCEAALAALANHPDYMLRGQVLDMMKDYWLPERPWAKQYVVLGMLRDGQYELAYSRLCKLLDEGVVVDGWVLDILIVVFGDLGFLDEMLVLVERRTQSAAGPDGANIQHYALDVCSQAFHHAGTVHAWAAVTKLAHLEPADGIVENVLATAARHGDTTLATRALDVLSRRGKILTSHYEAVCDAFAQARDVAGLLRIGRIMKQNGVLFLRPSTRVLHAAMRGSAAMVVDADAALRKLEPDGKTPRFMLAALLEAVAELRGSEAVLDLYAAMPRLCGADPDALLLHALMLHSHQPETRRRLAADYMAAIPADPRRPPQAWNALIASLLAANHLDLAFRFAKHAISSALPARAALPDWVQTLVEKAAATEDDRIWPIVDQLGRVAGTQQKTDLHLWLSRTRFARQSRLEGLPS